jgi:AcrR family transcriptional regulator
VVASTAPLASAAASSEAASGGQSMGQRVYRGLAQAARRHLAADGANLSPRAVARELGMTSSATHRYFASRDELLTALITDAYDAMGSAAEAAEASAGRADLLGRWLAACHAVRESALANPHEYALIYGSPVPGYRAPQDTVAPGARVPLLIGAILRGARQHRQRATRLLRAPDADNGRPDRPAGGAGWIAQQAPSMPCRADFSASCKRSPQTYFTLIHICA